MRSTQAVRDFCAALASRETWPLDLAAKVIAGPRLPKEIGDLSSEELYDLCPLTHLPDQFISTHASSDVVTLMQAIILWGTASAFYYLLSVSCPISTSVRIYRRFTTQDYVIYRSKASTESPGTEPGDPRPQSDGARYRDSILSWQMSQ